MSHYCDCPDPCAVHGTYHPTRRTKAKTHKMTPQKPISSADATKILNELAEVLAKRAPNIRSLIMDVVLNPPFPSQIDGDLTKGTFEYHNEQRPSVRFFVGEEETAQYLDGPVWLPHVPEAQWELVLSKMDRLQREYQEGPPLQKFLTKLKSSEWHRLPHPDYLRD